MPPTNRLAWAVVSLVLAAVGTLGSLYLSLGLGLKACPLCLYQRTFVMSVFAVLAVGLLVDRSRCEFLTLLCLPLAAAGLAVAGFHEYLVLSGKLECPQAILGIGTAPEQSLAIFVLLTAAVAIAALRNVAAMAVSITLGLALAWGCIARAPPMPRAPDKPYEQPLDMCRPPYQPR